MSGITHFERISGMTVSSLGYALLNTKWGPAVEGTSGGVVTYTFPNVSFGPQMTEIAYQARISEALDTWSQVADITFQYTANNTADFVFYWEDIDGPGSTLAQAFTTDATVLTSENNVDISFDIADYNRSANANSEDVQDFSLVAIHEIGHGLGLDHPEDSSQIMYAFFDRGNDALAVGDIYAASKLYGPSKDTSTPYAIGTDGNDALNRATSAIDMQAYGFDGNDTIQTGSGNDQIFAGLGDDSIRANNGDDMIFDAFGDDTLNGGNGRDNIESYQGNNRLNGGDGSDALRGGVDGDTITGGAGDDYIIADPSLGVNSFWFGDDRIIGGAGNDLLSGGGGADIFVFSPNEGNDQIGQLGFNSNSGFSISGGDFEIGSDRVDVRSFNFGSQTDVIASLRSSGNDVIFDNSGTTITLHDVALSDISINDFVWA